MIANLVRNAIDAHEEASIDLPIEVRVAVGSRLVFRVLDRGRGLSVSTAQRIGQPFVTTKASTGGLGLGVYLARRFAERLGGELRYEPRPGGGLAAELALPLDPLRSGR
jgi:two-component system sensor histidine kinase RegB